MQYTTEEQALQIKKIYGSNKFSDLYIWQSEGKNYLYAGTPQDENAICLWSNGALIELLSDLVKCDISIIRSCGKWHIKIDKHLHFTYEESLTDALVDIIIYICKQKKNELSR